MQEWSMEGVTTCFPMLAARAHKNLLDLRNMGGARSMRAVWKAPGHPLPWQIDRDILTTYNDPFLLPIH